MNGLTRIAAAGAASLLRWVSRAPIGCGARLLAWSARLEVRAKAAPGGGGMPDPHG